MDGDSEGKKQSRLILRKARSDEFRALCEVQRDANMRYAEGYVQYPFSEDSFNKCCPYGCFEVAQTDAGTIAGYSFSFPCEGDLYLCHLFTRSNMRGHGIGAELLDSVIAKARYGKKRAVTLSTKPKVHWNLPYYEKREFSVIRKKRDMPDYLFGCFLEGLSFYRKNRESLKPYGVNVVMQKVLG